MSLSPSGRSVAVADNVVGAAAAELMHALPIRSCRFEPWPAAMQRPRIEADRVVLPADEVGIRPFAAWRPADGIDLPVRVGDIQLGSFVLIPRDSTVGVAFPRTAREHALAIADSVGAALGERLIREGGASWLM